MPWETFISKEDVFTLIPTIPTGRFSDATSALRWSCIPLFAHVCTSSGLLTRLHCWYSTESRFPGYEPISLLPHFVVTASS